MFVTKEFTFDSAHFLENYYGKCENMHGHTYKLHVTFQGLVKENGLVIDFVIIKDIVKKQVLEELDHKLLNDIIKNPSAERIAVWIWDKLKDVSKQYDGVTLYEVKLWETPNSFVTYRGE